MKDDFAKERKLFKKWASSQFKDNTISFEMDRCYMFIDSIANALFIGFVAGYLVRDGGAK